MAAVGVDGCPSGWIALALRPGQRPEAHFLASIRALAAAVPDARVVAIDIPIGLPESGRREADVLAREFLGPRRQSVFFAPVREALASATHAAATAASTRLTGSGVSQQAYALARRIFEVESWHAEAPCPVFEVHPEVSFAVLTGAPARARKQSWAGMVERRTALSAAGIHLDGITGTASVQANVDDLLDAAVAAWSARRLLGNAARSFPEPPEIDGRGQRIAIWA
jgi:predicted RNase H-like nuclease